MESFYNHPIIYSLINMNQANTRFMQTKTSFQNIPPDKQELLFERGSKYLQF